MDVCLQVPCFRYCGKDFAAQLTVQQANVTDLMIRCPVRHGLYYLTPEERVRQALIWFLLEGAGNEDRWRERLRFEVEQRSLDVAAFLARDAGDDRFVINIPVLIVETKRHERDLADAPEVEEQLQTYMVRERCRSGLIFNGHQAAWLSLCGEFTEVCWSKECLTDLGELEERLQKATLVATAKAVEYRLAFNTAAAGAFDSLLRLVMLIGSDSRLTINLSVRVRGKLTPIQAFGIQKLDADTITYRTRAVVSRNRQHLTRQDFHSLVAIRPV